MKVLQTVSGDKSFIDFAITKDEKVADIYSISSSSLIRENFKEKLDKYVTLTESGIPWNKIKIEKGKEQVDTEKFEIISAFLTGSTRGRSDSTFENGNGNPDPESDPKRQRMEITLSIDTRLTNEDEYQELIKQIRENEQKRRDQLDDYVRGWESMSPEEIEELNRKYDDAIKQEAEQQIQDDPDYEPDSNSDSDSDSDSSNYTTSDDDEADTNVQPK
jgi:hypothetical protein